MAENDWKKRLGTMYSTNPDYKFEYEGNKEETTPEPSAQDLKISLDRKKRKGKTVSLISGFMGKGEDLDKLAALLKKRCGTGGSVKEGIIIIQGDFRERLKEILQNEGFKVKVI